jgi:hypothetical protein
MTIDDELAAQRIEERGMAVFTLVAFQHDVFLQMSRRSTVKPST